MKTQFVADDGKVFTSREEALKYEANKKDVDAGKQALKEEIDKIDKKIEALVDEIHKLIDEKDKLLDEFRDKYLSEKQKKVLDELESFIDVLFGDKAN